MTGEPVAAGTERERVILGECALAIHRGHHRALQQFRKLDQFLARLGVQHALPREDHRTRRIHQQPRRLLDIMRRRRGARRTHRSVIERLAADIELQQIARQFNHYWPGPSVFQLAERTPHRRRHLLRHNDVLGLLGDRGIGAAGMEHRKHLRLLAGMTQRQEQHRHGIGKCRGDAGKGVLSTRPVLHGEHARRPAIGHPRIAVRHVDADALLAADNGSQPTRHGGLDHRRGGKAEQRSHAFTLQDFHDGMVCSHLSPPRTAFGKA